MMHLNLRYSCVYPCGSKNENPASFRIQYTTTNTSDTGKFDKNTKCISIKIIHTTSFSQWMWWQLHRWQRHTDVAIPSRPVPRFGELCLPHLPAEQHLRQINFSGNGLNLSRAGHWIRPPRDTWWQFRRLATDWNILWKYQPSPTLPTVHPKSFTAEVRRVRLLKRDVLWNKL